MLETKQFVRKPFEVVAVQVTADNFYEVAKWCQGDINSASGDDGKFIRVRVLNVINPKQTQAFVGDWVLYASTGYKVYTDKAFKKSFEEKVTPTVSSPLEVHDI